MRARLLTAAAFTWIAPCAATAQESEPLLPQEPREHEVDESAAAGCPGDGSCCIEHGPGCSDFLCCFNVCGIDPTCCSQVWDAGCVLLAEEECGDLCSQALCPAPGDCCATHSGGGCTDASCCTKVCAQRPSCCTISWSDACVALADEICGPCEPRCPREGLCCFGHPGTPGCEREGCCELICSKHDDYCCTNEWDNKCASHAQRFCPNVCECLLFGDFDESSGIDLLDFAAFQLCFTADGAGPVVDGCACSDYDGDDDADLADFEHFALD